ncbi:MAG TPA: hypothetical protein VEB39_09065 [Sphingomicrobium sp.]|nr:hypothetical protein [Sphingomicrobium sp.]
MKQKCEKSRRVELGRVSTSTKGGPYGAIEQVGLFRTGIEL